MKAAKKVIFGVCKEYMDVKKLIVCEQRLHRVCSPTLKLLIKIDGRPFYGKYRLSGLSVLS